MIICASQRLLSTVHMLFFWFTLISCPMAQATTPIDRVSEIQFNGLTVDTIADLGFPQTFIEIKGDPLPSNAFVYSPRTRGLVLSELKMDTLTYSYRNVSFDGTYLSGSTGVTYNFQGTPGAPDQGFSFALWMRPDRLERNEGVVVHKGRADNPSAHNDFFIWYIGSRYNEKGHVCVAATQQSQTTELMSARAAAFGQTPKQLPIGQWSHIAVTCGVNGFKLYQDGLLVDALATCPYLDRNHVDTGGRLTFGSYTTPLDSSNQVPNPILRDRPFLGGVDEYIAVERELSATEVLALARKSYIFKLNFNAPIISGLPFGQMNPEALLDQSGARNNPFQPRNLYHFLSSLWGNAISTVVGVDSPNSGNYLVLPESISFTDLPTWTVGISHNPRGTKNPGEVLLNQMVELPDGSHQGTIKIFLEDSPFNNVYFLKILYVVNGTLNTFVLNDRATLINDWNLFSLGWDGRCLSYYHNGVDNPQELPAAQQCPILPQDPPQALGNTWPHGELPVFYAAGQVDVNSNANPTPTRFLNAYLDNLFISPNAKELNPPEICTSVGPNPQTFATILEPSFPNVEIVTFQWREYAGAPSNAYAIQVESTSVFGVGFAVNNVTAVCSTISGQRICQASYQFPYSTFGPNYRWRVRVNAYEGAACLNTSWSLYRSFSYFPPIALNSTPLGFSTSSSQQAPSGVQAQTQSISTQAPYDPSKDWLLQMLARNYERHFKSYSDAMVKSSLHRVRSEVRNDEFCMEARRLNLLPSLSAEVYDPSTNPWNETVVAEGQEVTSLISALVSKNTDSQIEARRDYLVNRLTWIMESRKHIFEKHGRLVGYNKP